MRIIAVDDEKLALESLMSSIQKAVPKEKILGFNNASKALDFVKGNNCDIAFLDIELCEMNGVELARLLKIINPNINIIFTTGCSEYTGAAFDLHASGYVLKPVTPDKIKFELHNLRRPVSTTLPRKKLQVKAFGSFEVYVDDLPLKFKYSKSKELLAYLIDRNGALCSNAEIICALWEDDNHISYLKNSRTDLIATLEKEGCGDVIMRQWGKLAVVPKKIDCDYFQWIAGTPSAINAYRGEYMNQFSWAELTHGLLEDTK